MPPTKKPAPPRLSFADALSELEAAGSEQTRKIYLRHGAVEPLFGVSFATLKALLKRIKVDHALAVGLWETGNHDARNLAVKVADPGALSADDLDRWALTGAGRLCTDYVALLALDGPHAHAKLASWLAADDARLRTAGWRLLGHLAQRDEGLADSEFLGRLHEIPSAIHAVTDAEREAMNAAVIAIGCRSEGLRAAAVEAATQIGRVFVDHGQTACKTPEVIATLDKAWAYATGKGFASPAAAEREREPLRLRC
jgi:hypothetical protein